MSGPEYRNVELPFLKHLKAAGWNVVHGDKNDPTVTGRTDFREVLRENELRSALCAINQRDGTTWLDDSRLSSAVEALGNLGTRRLIEANQAATELLHAGLDVDGFPDWDQGRTQTVRYVDWEHPERNVFTAVNQYRVDCPPGQAKAFIEPDVVLFVNGIPVVVVECKDPNSTEPIPSAVDQLRRYHNQRRADGEVEANEGNERLFHTNQFLIATSGEEARAGTIGADLPHYMEWKTVEPAPMEKVETELKKAGLPGSGKLTSQQKLVAGMLRPEHLIDILRHFVLFKEDDRGRTVKVVSRYQQFRAVQRSIERLKTGKTRLEDGELDRRGGVIWHTQGSGKSLTMVFLVRKMRSERKLRHFKIVFITDRKDLERQLVGTVRLTGEKVEVVKKVRDVKKYLGVKGPGVVFVMVQKYGDRNEQWTDFRLAGEKRELRSLGRLNDDPSILLLTDEAHRSHASTFHAHIEEALPNAAGIGFTGTPILMGAKKRTHQIFGDFIDKYKLQESEADGATVPILYEGRTAKGVVADGRDLDQVFEDMCLDRSPDELEAIKRKYGTKGNVLEAQKMIEAKARDMLRHYVANILPDGLKAQVVASSRKAAVRYQAALLKARDELVAEARGLDGKTRQTSDEDLAAKPRKVRATVCAWRYLDELEQLEFGTVVSPKHNDPGEWSAWTDGAKIKQRIDAFKKPLRHAEESKRDPLAFLIVKSMLLTGFDAPIEGVLYLDRAIREAELLQAVARVNRTGHGKEAGIVVDYYGVANHLKKALAAYSAEDVEGVLCKLADEVPKLRDRHQRLHDLLKSHGVDPADVEECIALLSDEKLAAQFVVRLKQFLATLDVVLPRPDAIPFIPDAKRFGSLYSQAARRLRTLPSLSKSTNRKVQRLIDEHVISIGIDPKIPPVSLTDEKFAEELGKHASDRAKASEMEHAIRHHVRKHMDENPVYFKKLSERLEEILKKYGEDWAQIAAMLEPLATEVREGPRVESDLGLGRSHLPFYDLLKELREREAPLSTADKQWLASVTVHIGKQIAEKARIVGFWSNPTRQEELRSAIFMYLEDEEEGLVGEDEADEVASQILLVARANRDNLEDL